VKNKTIDIPVNCITKKLKCMDRDSLTKGNTIIGNLCITISIIILLINSASAHAEEDFAKAEDLIKSKISCSESSDEQLEIIGEYYMEQMHPGKLHEIMDERMGGEVSESLKQIHINMARSFYCGESDYISSTMMNTMMGRSGMMGNAGFYYQNNQTYIITTILVITIIILLIILIINLIKKAK